MTEKRNRSSNWDEEEKQLFRCVLKEHACTIENKSLNTNTNKLKLKAWEEVHRKFNQLNSRPRDLNQLKVQWKAMKVQARKSCSGFRKEFCETGGGLQSTPLFTTQSEVTIPEYNLLQVPQEDAIVAPDASEDEVIGEVIPKPLDRTNLTITGLGKKVVKQKPALHSALKPKKAKQDYVKGMISLSEKLKNEEHCRRMQMAEEEHQIKITHLMDIQKEKLKREKRLLEMEWNGV